MTSIRRTPSVALIEETRAQVSSRKSGYAADCGAKLDAYLGSADETQAIVKGRRLFDLARDLATPNQATAPKAHSAAPRMTIPQEVVALVVHAVETHSDKFKDAQAVVAQTDFIKLGTSIICGTLQQTVQMLTRAPVDVTDLQEELKGIFAELFIGEDLMFKYATHISAESLKALTSTAAINFREGTARMTEVLSRDIPGLIARLLNEGTDKPVAPLKGADKAKFEAMEKWLEANSPETLARFDELATSTADGPNLVAHARREVILLLANAMGGYNLDELAAFQKSPAGVELKQKEKLVAMDSDSQALQTRLGPVVNRFVTESLQKAREEQLRAMLSRLSNQ